MEFQSLTPASEAIESLKSMVLQMKEGTKLASERALVKELGVSRTTLRNALEYLVKEGKIEEDSDGTFSTIRKHKINLLDMSSMSDELKSEFHQLKIEMISNRVLEPSENVAGYLGLSDNEKIVELTRKRLLDDIPVTFEIAHLDYQKFPALLGIDFNNRSLYKTLKELYKVVPAYGHETVSSTNASGNVAEVLNVSEGTPLYLISSFSYDNHDEIIEFTHQYLVGQRVQYQIKVNNIFDYRNDLE